MFGEYYKVLGIKEGADEKTVKKAYRTLALKYHPDVNKAANASEHFQKICEAYEIVLRQIEQETLVNIYETTAENYEAIYEEIIREAREEARKRVRMKYERIKAEKDFFRNNDLFILFRYIGNYIALPLGLALIIIPVYLAITEEFMILFATMFFWIIGIFILKNIYDRRKTWFRPGRLKARPSDIFLFFSAEKRKNATGECFFIKGEKANSKPFRYTMLKVRDIKLSHEGVYQHYVRYSRKYREIVLPRSAKAFHLHTFLSFLKPICLLLSILFLPIPSLIWRIVAGLLLALFLSNIILLVSRTRSKTSFLLNRFLLLKVCIWLMLIVSQTSWYGGVVLFTSEKTVLFLMLFLVFLDMFLDLFLRLLPFYKKMYLPLIKQPAVILELYKNGYQAYMDLPVWSTVFPFFRWLF